MEIFQGDWSITLHIVALEILKPNIVAKIAFVDEENHAIDFIT